MHVYAIDGGYDVLDQEDVLEQQAAELRQDLARGITDHTSGSIFEPDVEFVL